MDYIPTKNFVDFDETMTKEFLQNITQHSLLPKFHEKLNEPASRIAQSAIETGKLIVQSPSTIFNYDFTIRRDFKNFVDQIFRRIAWKF